MENFLFNNNNKRRSAFEAEKKKKCGKITSSNGEHGMKNIFRRQYSEK